jgi:hypothetical protein
MGKAVESKFAFKPKSANSKQASTRPARPLSTTSSSSSTSSKKRYTAFTNTVASPSSATIARADAAGSAIANATFS